LFFPIHDTKKHKNGLKIREIEKINSCTYKRFNDYGVNVNRVYLDNSTLKINPPIQWAMALFFEFTLKI
jgi:hypothetical protein